MSGPNWDLFPLFSVVARTGSVNRAAQELGMSQPTLSRRVRELERYVGAPLFFRVSSGVKLTQEGKDLQRSTNVMIAAFEGLQKDLRSRFGQRSSLVRIRFVRKSTYITVITPAIALGMRAQNSVSGTILNHAK